MNNVKGINLYNQCNEDSTCRWSEVSVMEESLLRAVPDIPNGMTCTPNLSGNALSVQLRRPHLSPCCTSPSSDGRRCGKVLALIKCDL